MVVLLLRLPAGLGFTGAAHVAGALGKLQAVDFSLDPSRRYTVWSGVFGGLFLALSYFGTDQSQVQRYIGGASLRESRLGLMFNAVLRSRCSSSSCCWARCCSSSTSSRRPRSSSTRRSGAATRRTAGSAPSRPSTPAPSRRASPRSARGSRPARRTTPRGKRARGPPWSRPAQRTHAIRAEAKAALVAADPRAKTKDSDYVFITFILTQLPHGVVGPAGRGDVRGRAVVEGRRARRARHHDDDRLLAPLPPARRGRRGAQRARGAVLHGAVGRRRGGFALFAGFAENLIQAINILGSIFYGVLLGLFLVAFFLRRVGGTAVFFAAAGRAGPRVRACTSRSTSATSGTTSSAAPRASPSAWRCRRSCRRAARAGEGRAA